MADWSNLPTDLLGIIVQKLIPNFVDILRFRAVCKSWRLISLKKPSNPLPQLPWLMLSSHKTTPTRRCFFSLSDDRVYNLNCGSFCCCFGSSHGWLLFMSLLLNPVTNDQISLPHIRSVFRQQNAYIDWDSMTRLENLVVKAILSSSPSFKANEDCFVMLIFGNGKGHLVFCKLGDSKWRIVIDRRHDPYEDVVYFKGQLCAVDTYGRIVVCDVTSPQPQTFELKARESYKADKNYLVESSGKLLLIRRFRGWSFDLDKVYKTVMFKVLEQDNISKDWVEVKTLGHHALFLGYNHSLSLLASEFSGCKGNCIYFTDNCFCDYDFGKAEPHDVGIFNLADGQIEPLPGYTGDFQLLKQPPLWITPSPW